MSSIAIIGAGISGLSCSDFLKDRHEITVFEQNSYPGGLIHCSHEENVLFHRVGGHVFNSKQQHVLDWFWSKMDKDDFLKVNRNAKIYLPNSTIVNYPIENYLYQLDEVLTEKIIDELLQLNKKEIPETYNFEDFLKERFGETLYEFYFKPYNTKIWRTDLTQIPLDWLAGKLPMPKISDIIKMNILKKEESQMVHSTFYYPKKGGSQFIADILSKGLPIRYNSPTHSFLRKDNKWKIGDQFFDSVIYTGNIKELSKSIADEYLPVSLKEQLLALKSNGTTTLLCEIDSTDTSWLYFPDQKIKAHRIIYTGNFSSLNNGKKKRLTATIEISGFCSEADFREELKKLPGHPTILAYNYHPASYIIHSIETRKIIHSVKEVLEKHGFYLLGRMAEWEYYNMDAAIDAAMKLSHKI